MLLEACKSMDIGSYRCSRIICVKKRQRASVNASRKWDELVQTCNRVWQCFLISTWWCQHVLGLEDLKSKMKFWWRSAGHICSGNAWMLDGSTRLVNLKLVQVNMFTQSEQQLGGSAILWTWVYVRFTTQCCSFFAEWHHITDITISVYKEEAYWELSSLALQFSTKLQSTLQATVQLL